MREVNLHEPLEQKIQVEGKWFNKSECYEHQSEANQAILQDLKQELRESQHIDTPEQPEAEVPEGELETDQVKVIGSTLENLTPEAFKVLCQEHGLEKNLTNILDKQRELETITDPEQKAEKGKALGLEIARFKGKVAELIERESLAPNFGEVVAEQGVKLADGSTTKIDLTCQEAQKDFKIGDVQVNKGENLYIESKVGTAAYIAGEMLHMLDKQLIGHHEAGKESGKPYQSVAVVSSDYHEISETKKEIFETKLQAIGSELVILEKSAAEFGNKTTTWVKEVGY